MKALKGILALLIIVAGLSCKKAQEDSSSLSYSMSNKTNLLPLEDQSCEDQAAGDPTVKSLTANSAKFSAITFSWSGRNDVELRAIYITLTGSALESSPQKFVLKFIANPTLAGVPEGGTASVHTETCGVRLGGVKIKSGVTSASISGRVQVVGMESDAEQNSSLVTAEGSISLEYKGL